MCVCVCVCVRVCFSALTTWLLSRTKYQDQCLMSCIVHPHPWFLEIALVFLNLEAFSLYLLKTNIWSSPLRKKNRTENKRRLWGTMIHCNSKRNARTKSIHFKISAFVLVPKTCKLLYTFTADVQRWTRKLDTDYLNHTSILIWDPMNPFGSRISGPWWYWCFYLKIRETFWFHSYFRYIEILDD